jgi:hypothetical protein
MTKKQIIITISIIAIIGILGGIIYYAIIARNAVQPKQSEINSSLQQGSDLANQAINTITGANSTTTYPTTNSYNLSNFEVQTISSNQYLLAVNASEANSFPIPLDDNLSTILGTSPQTYDTSKTFYIMDYSQNKIYLLGYGVGGQIKNITVNNQPKLLVYTTDLFGTATVYTIDDDLQHVTKYTLNLNDIVNNIDVNSQNQLVVTTANGNGGTATETKVTLNLSDLKNEGTSSTDPSMEDLNQTSQTNDSDSDDPITDIPPSTTTTTPASTTQNQTQTPSQNTTDTSQNGSTDSD